MKNMRKRRVLMKSKQMVLERWKCECFSLFQAFAINDKFEVFPGKFKTFSGNWWISGRDFFFNLFCLCFVFVFFLERCVR
jgi:hypothetical protein